MSNEEILRAAVNVLMEPILALLQGDPHQWSDRPCPTCRAIGSIVGKPFGCYVYAIQRQQQRAPQEKKP